VECRDVETGITTYLIVVNQGRFERRFRGGKKYNFWQDCVIEIKVILT
jgi:hypothetical protein